MNTDALVGAFGSIALSVRSHFLELIVEFLGGVAAYAITLYFIQPLRAKLLERNICGVDINKTTAEKRAQVVKKWRAGGLAALEEDEKRLVVPESLGILAGAVYLCVVVVQMAIVFGGDIRKLNGALTSITVMLLLGFVDDVLDILWRHKLLLSAIGSLPLIMSYEGSFSVVVPSPLLPFFPAPVVYLGSIYFFYLSMLCIFCTNSINILAGVNGVEVGQSVVIAIACVVHNVLQLRLDEDQSPNGSRCQLMAIGLLTPFIGVSAALWRYNRHPASIFIGDSYTYFAGTVLSVSGVTGLYSKTLMLFFAPQLFNFLISLPQLFRIVPCPRHRVPQWDPKRNVLKNSGNYTVLNCILWLFGDMHEHALTMIMLRIQMASCITAFVVRYLFASYLYDHVH